MSDTDNLCRVGHVSRTQGHQGGLRIKSGHPLMEILHIGEPVFVRMEQGPVPFFVRSIHQVGGDVEIQFDWINGADQAEKLVGLEILISNILIATEEEEQLETLVGWQVTDEHFGPLGTLTEIMEMKAHGVLRIDYQGTEVLIPAVDDIILGVDREVKTLYINAPEGLIELYLNA